MGGRARRGPRRAGVGDDEHEGAASAKHPHVDVLAARRHKRRRLGAEQLMHGALDLLLRRLGGALVGLSACQCSQRRYMFDLCRRRRYRLLNVMGRHAQIST